MMIDVLVLGSAVMDLVVHTDRFPVPGETVLGHDFRTFAGGKGANQAVAIAKLGGRVAFAGKLGKDLFGDSILQSLREARVDTSHCLRTADESTAVGSITIGPGGLNEIVVVPGANMLFSPREAVAAVDSFPSAAFLVLQLEIPLEANLAALEEAHKRGMTTLLNPAPAHELPEAIFRQVDWLTPNEFEVKKLTGIDPVDEKTCASAAEELHRKGVPHVVITLGARGAYYHGEQGSFSVEALEVEAKDTTGAGDAFTGAIAHFLSRGEDVRRALELATRVASISVTRSGAQASMPMLNELFANR